MTISEEAHPKDLNIGRELSSRLDNIKDLVRILDDKARAADENALALAEDEGNRDTQLQGTSCRQLRPSLFTHYESESLRSHRFSQHNDFRSERKIFANIEKDDSIQTVVGVREEYSQSYDDVIRDLAERMELLESRLDECEDTKRSTALSSEYILPQSTFSLLVTENPLSWPFIFALFTVSLSITCLGLVLADAVSIGTPENRLNVPPGVSAAVRGAQFVGILVGVLFEDECRQGLQHIAHGAGHTLLLDGKKKIHKRLIAVSILRLVVGYLFLSSLFISVVQNSDVINIFYDVLALEFVENIDDTAFALAMKGFLGQHMLVATVKKHTLLVLVDTPRRSIMQSGHLFGASQTSVSRGLFSSGSLISNSMSNRAARLIYFLNAVILLVGLAYISEMQSRGEYRCSRLHVAFNEEIWENATVSWPNGSTSYRLLVYPYFNGIYAAEGSVDGHPRYIEQDKHSGSPFVSRKGAEIRYCEEIESWVFAHPEIKTSNECGWLFRSYQVTPETEYDVINASKDPWIAWTGEVVWDSRVAIKCTSCSDEADCSYHGYCHNGVCSCNFGRTGGYCEFDKPCSSLATEKASKLGLPGSLGHQWIHENPITLMSGQVYNRPVYIQTNLTDDPFDWRKFDVRQQEPASKPLIQPSASTSPSTPLQAPLVGTNRTRSPRSGVDVPTYEPTQSPRPKGIPRFREDTTSPTLIFGGIFDVSTSPSFPANFTSPRPLLTNESESREDSLEAFQDLSPRFPAHSPHLHSMKAANPAPTYAPTKPWNMAHAYELGVEDFADYDDFFGGKPLHDLDEILKNYSVVMSFTGSRFYATIIEPGVTFIDIFPPDYHAFWDDSFNINRTFVISDKTNAGTPIGIDFFEMRRRIPSIEDENIHFAYGPFGALIPNMKYAGTGFFHCLDPL